MITSYKKTKEDVLAAYDQFCELVESVNQGKELTTYDDSVKLLKVQADDIKQNKFMLMVVGEAKSGKSTFINAYLGEEVLPMGMKQCTSAIVRIKYGKQFILRATFADDTSRIIEGREEIHRFLIEHAAIDDQYREIPVPTINIDIIMNSHGKQPCETTINNLIQGIKNDNIYKLPEEVYKNKVRQYIAEKIPEWHFVVKEIEIEYPFEDEDLRGIEIVDTPGVNALGRVGDITEDNIAKANAVMFLKPILGSSLEATSFKDFLNTSSADRNKGAMFLLLTRAANVLPSQVQEVYEDALAKFPEISRDQILYVDSKVEMFYNTVAPMSQEELENYISSLIDNKQLDSFIETPWYRSRMQKAEFMKELKELSNFPAIDAALNQFAHKAHFLALSEFLGRMDSVIKKIKANLEDNQDSYEKMAKDPNELAIKLTETENRLEQLTNSLSNKLASITKKYATLGGIIDTKAAEEVEAYKKDIAGITKSNSNSVDELQKYSFRLIDKFLEYENQLQKFITADCDDALVGLSREFSLDKIDEIVPDVTKQEILQEIKDIEEEERSKTEPYTEGVTFKKTRQRSTFSQSVYFERVKDSIDTRIDKIQADCVGRLKTFVATTTRAYSGQLRRNIDIKQAEYKKLEEEKKSAEEIQVILHGINKKLGQVIPLGKHINALKGGIDQYV